MDWIRKRIFGVKSEAKIKRTRFDNDDFVELIVESNENGGVLKDDRPPPSGLNEVLENYNSDIFDEKDSESGADVPPQSAHNHAKPKVQKAYANKPKRSPALPQNLHKNQVKNNIIIHQPK